MSVRSLYGSSYKNRAPSQHGQPLQNGFNTAPGGQNVSGPSGLFRVRLETALWCFLAWFILFLVHRSLYEVNGSAGFYGGEVRELEFNPVCIPLGSSLSRVAIFDGLTFYVYDLKF